MHRMKSALCLPAAILLSLSAMPSFGQQPSPEPAGSPAAQPTPARAKIAYSSAHVDGKYIALTFDDGPHPKLTPKLLALLAARHIKVTFFLIGENVQAHPEIAKEEIAEGHEVGNHSWSHPNLRKLPEDKLRSEMQRTDDVIKSAIGHSPTLMRPPYGELSAAQAVLVNREFGYKVIRWDVDPLDWKDPGPSVVAARILSQTRPGSIILSHDIHAGTVAAMPIIIDTLLAKGYKFVTVPELIAMDRPPLKKAAAQAAGAVPSPTTPPAGTGDSAPAASATP
jgi:peptidoglycan/xylan/chitin deacetylase (PgdA/CDA1 family)